MELNLEEIRYRAHEATPGPWVAELARTWFVGNENNLFVAEFPTGPIAGAADAAFVAAAREDIPNLCAEVERLRIALEQSQREQFAGSCPAVSPSDQPCIGRAFWHEVHADRIGSTWRDYAGKVCGSGLHVSGATRV